jgi:hypothetical protein
MHQFNPEHEQDARSWVRVVLGVSQGHGLGGNGCFHHAVRSREVPGSPA